MSPAPERVEILRAGTRVRKIRSTADDLHQDGSRGTVTAHLGPAVSEDGHLLIGYYIEWDDLPGRQVFIAGPRLVEVRE